MRRRLGEAPKQRHVDGRVELRDRFTRNTKPFGRLVGTAAIQPLGSLEPIAEKQRVFVEAEMLQHKAQRAGGRVLAVEMMVVEVGLRRVVASTDIDDRYRRVIEVVVGGVSPEHRGPVPGYEYADGQEVVFMGAAGMRDNGFNHAASQHTGSRISVMLRSYLLAGPSAGAIFAGTVFRRPGICNRRLTGPVPVAPPTTSRTSQLIALEVRDRRARGVG